MKAPECVNLILIETSTSLCSVALSQGGKVKAYRESTEPRAQASLCAPYIKEVMEEGGIGIQDLDGVCVSAGPGSYTGLRVGVSSAKGLCFGAGIPLYAMSTTQVLAQMGKGEDVDYIIPMIDARRMEVYTTVYKADTMEQLSEIEAKVIDERSFREYLDNSRVLFIGDGAQKCSELLASPSSRFIQCCPSARYMAETAQGLYLEGKSVDIAYFEPFYLKDFIATVSKKKL